MEIRQLWQLWDQLVLKEGLLYRKFFDCKHSAAVTYLLVVPLSLRQRILKEVHEGVFGGHLGEEKTFHNLKFHTTGQAAEIQLRDGAIPVCPAPIVYL